MQADSKEQNTRSRSQKLLLDTRQKKVFVSTIEQDKKLNALKRRVDFGKPDSVSPARNTRSSTKRTDPATQVSTENILTQSKKLGVVKREQFVKLDSFEKNSIVLAKQKYSCPWPARVLEIQKQKVLVYFFGDKRSGFVDRSEIYDFVKSSKAIKSVISSKKVPSGYSTGVLEIELLLNNNVI